MISFLMPAKIQRIICLKFLVVTTDMGANNADVKIDYSRKIEIVKEEIYKQEENIKNQEEKVNP